MYNYTYNFNSGSKAQNNKKNTTITSVDQMYNYTYNFYSGVKLQI